MLELVPMKAVVLFKSLTGNTRRAAEYIATDLQQEGWGVTAVCPWNQPEMAAIQEADLVVVGTWVDGLFLVGQKPFAVNAIQHLPAMQGKLAATYCTYAINPGRTLAKLDQRTDIQQGMRHQRQCGGWPGVAPPQAACPQRRVRGASRGQRAQPAALNPLSRGSCSGR